MNEIIRPLPQEEALRRLREKLAEKVPNNKLRERDGPSNTKLKYIDDDYILTKLDEIFGPLNWDRKVLEESIAAEFQGAPKRKQETNWQTKKTEWVDYIPECVIARARCQITVRYANQIAVFEDVGTIVREVDLKNKPAAYMQAIKGAVTDGYKRCAAQIGNIFGRGLEKNQTDIPDYSDAVFVEANIYVVDNSIIDGEVVEPTPTAIPLQAPSARAPAPAVGATAQQPAAHQPSQSAQPQEPAASQKTSAPAATEAVKAEAPLAAAPAAPQASPPAAAAAPSPAKQSEPAPAASSGTFAPGAKFANNAPPAGAARGQPVTSTLSDLRAMYVEIEKEPLKWDAAQWKAFTVAFSNVIANAEVSDIEPLGKALTLTEKLVTDAMIGSVVKDIPIWLASLADRLKRRRVSFGLT